MSEVNKNLEERNGKNPDENHFQNLRLTQIEDSFYLQRQLKHDSANDNGYEIKKIILNKVRRLVSKYLNY